MHFPQSICERGFSCMHLLKTARRQAIGTKLLRILMVICQLGSEWKNPAKIPVDEIIDIWRAESTKGRYKGNDWLGLGASPVP